MAVKSTPTLRARLDLLSVTVKAVCVDASTDLSAEQPLQESLLRRRRRLSSPVEVRRNRPVLIEDVQLREAARVDHLRDERYRVSERSPGDARLTLLGQLTSFCQGMDTLPVDTLL